MIITLSFLSFSIFFTYQRFSSCSSTVDVGFVKLLSGCFYGNGFSRIIMSSAVTFAAAVLWFLDTVLFSVQQSLSLSSGFLPLFLLAYGVFPWFVYAVITLDTATQDTPNKVAILVTDASAKCTPTVCPLWKLTSFPFCSTFIWTVTKHNFNALTLVLHSVNKQKNKIQLRFFQCSQHKQFYFYIVVFPLFSPSPVNSSKIFKTILKLQNTWPFPRRLRGN